MTHPSPSMIRSAFTLDRNFLKISSKKEVVREWSGLSVLLRYFDTHVRESTFPGTL